MEKHSSFFKEKPGTGTNEHNPGLFVWKLTGAGLSLTPHSEPHICCHLLSMNNRFGFMHGSIVSHLGCDKYKANVLCTARQGLLMSSGGLLRDERRSHSFISLRLCEIRAVETSSSKWRLDSPTAPRATGAQDLFLGGGPDWETHCRKMDTALEPRWMFF